MRRTAAAVGVALALAACSGAGEVATVNGATFDVDDIPITTEESSINLETFRVALNWLIRDQVLTAAAREDYGLTLDPAEVEDLAVRTLASLSPNDQLDPRANLDYFLIQARVGRSGLLWDELAERLPEDLTENQWALESLRRAEVEVDPRYGEWRTSPEPLVYEP